MSKRTFWIIVIVGILIAIGIVLFVFKSPKTPSDSLIDKVDEFMPFGNNKPSNIPKGQEQTTGDQGQNVTNETTGEVKIPRLRLVSSMPISGATTFEKIKVDGELKTSVTIARYMARENGNVFEKSMDDFIERTISKTIIPKINETFWGVDGSVALVRYLKNDIGPIQTFIGIVPKEIVGGDSKTDMRGDFMEENILGVTVKNDGLKSFHLLRHINGVVGILMDLQTKKKTQVFDSAFSEWIPQWAGSKNIFLTTKPSYDVPGFLYDLNIDTESFSKVLSGINGLTTNVSPDKKSLLYSNNQLELRVLDLATKESKSLGIKTLPEKCQWSSDSVKAYCLVPKSIPATLNYPDDWYLGMISFNDNIFELDIKSNSGVLLPTGSVLAKKSIDGINPILDKDGHFLFFTNKIDGYLWAYTLE